MTTNRSFQAYNSINSKPPICSMKKTVPIASVDESLAFGRIPYSSIRTKTGTVPSSPVGIIKPTSMTSKRRSSTISLSNLLPRRKSLQTTALATRRQSLWMNIARNAPPTNDDTQSSILPLRQEHTNLMRKKILRLLLVFSYLLSISLLAIALATFYGFFWSGYGTPQQTNVFDVKTTVRSLVSLTSNSTFVDSKSEIEQVT